MSLDPESTMFPFESNYVANHNNPVMFVDQPGDFPVAAVFAGFAIGVAGDFTMQMIKGIVRGLMRGDSFGKSFTDTWNGIDLADVFVSGLIGGAMPGLGIYREGLDLLTKQLRKRIVKYTGKLLMLMFDYRIVTEKVDDKRTWEHRFSFSIFNVRTGNTPKSRKYHNRDRIFTLIGILIQELDFASELIFSVDGKAQKNTSLSTLDYGEGYEFSSGTDGSKFDVKQWVYGFRLRNIISNWSSQMTIEGLAKGLMYKTIMNKLNVTNPMSNTPLIMGPMPLEEDYLDSGPPIPYEYTPQKIPDNDVWDDRDGNTQQPIPEGST